MRKKEEHAHDLAKLFDEFIITGVDGKIIEYLTSNSNLPGPRANLELAEMFAEIVEEYCAKDCERLRDLCQKLIGFKSDIAPVNDPKEFLPFCGAVGIGSIGSVSKDFFQKSLPILRESANDPRWRMREAVAKGIQELISKQSQGILRELETWIIKEDWLVMRAVAAGAAEPTLLRDKHTARSALNLHIKIFRAILDSDERKSEDFKILKKGLGYTLSVVICAIPEEGFEYLYQLVDSRDKDVMGIIKENLKKNRLIKNFPDEVTSLKKLLK